MKTKTIEFGENNEYAMTIMWSLLGLEKYYIDGQLVKKRWNFSRSDVLEFMVDHLCIKIETHYSFKEYYTRVYVNNDLYIEELFPEIAEKLEVHRSRRRSPRYWITEIVIWMAVGFFGTYLYRVIEAYK